MVSLRASTFYATNPKGQRDAPKLLYGTLVSKGGRKMETTNCPDWPPAAAQPKQEGNLSVAFYSACGPGVEDYEKPSGETIMLSGSRNTRRNHLHTCCLPFLNLPRVQSWKFSGSQNWGNGL